MSSPKSVANLQDLAEKLRSPSWRGENKLQHRGPAYDARSQALNFLFFMVYESLGGIRQETSPFALFC